ncbi:hypothetical protein VP01_1350g2 [Puccinia sorghi]|uniref:Uncharacterized protein n=1 Tax=Puccinia sorghi TaxID=27349 RepID=A0A0L6VM66_9BASI|nr:hypothetical protein VP01_1350g2 [Puccinia sorghi]
MFPSRQHAIISSPFGVVYMLKFLCSITWPLLCFHYWASAALFAIQSLRFEVMICSLIKKPQLKIPLSSLINLTRTNQNIWNLYYSFPLNLFLHPLLTIKLQINSLKKYCLFLFSLPSFLCFDVQSTPLIFFLILIYFSSDFSFLNPLKSSLEFVSLIKELRLCLAESHVRSIQVCVIFKIGFENPSFKITMTLRSLILLMKLVIFIMKPGARSKIGKYNDDLWFPPLIISKKRKVFLSQSGAAKWSLTIIQFEFLPNLKIELIFFPTEFHINLKVNHLPSNFSHMSNIIYLIFPKKLNCLISPCNILSSPNKFYQVFPIILFHLILLIIPTIILNIIIIRGIKYNKPTIRNQYVMRSHALVSLKVVGFKPMKNRYFSVRANGAGVRNYGLEAGYNHPSLSTSTSLEHFFPKLIFMSSQNLVRLYKTCNSILKLLLLIKYSSQESYHISSFQNFPYQHTQSTTSTFEHLVISIEADTHPL